MPWAAFPPDDDPRDVRVAFGRGIRALRLYHGLSQMELDHLSGLDQSIISRLETGRPVSVRFSRVLGLLDALGVDRTVFKSRIEGATMLAFMTRGDPSWYPLALNPSPTATRTTTSPMTNGPTSKPTSRRAPTPVNTAVCR